MARRCENAYKDTGDDTLRCRLMGGSGNCCGYTKFCRLTGHWENSEGFAQCTLRRRIEIKQDLKGEERQ